jgi:two-component system, NtrC family, response regulator AtoC
LKKVDKWAQEERAMGIEKILLVDEDAAFRNQLKQQLEAQHYHVAAVESGRKALALLKEHAFDLLIVEMQLSGFSGLHILEKSSAPVLIVTGGGSIQNAVEAMRAGAVDYLSKPVSLDALQAAIDRMQESAVQRTRAPLKRSAKLPFKVIAESPSIKRIISQIGSIARSHASVCIYGESGTGKEVIAKLIHEGSPRCCKPFIKVNCAAIPESLIESEFFGHEKGAFTGAAYRRLGRFELAHEGSLLLDEISETPLSLQAKLLRAVQEQEFERVGGSQPVKVDVRLISTSNRDIQEALAQKILREDLYYRLNVIPIFLPPLRERKEEILPLADYFLHKFSLENNVKLAALSQAAKQKLLEYHWPGNVRELANLMERAVIMGSGEQIGADVLGI